MIIAVEIAFNGGEDGYLHQAFEGVSEYRTTIDENMESSTVIMSGENVLDRIELTMMDSIIISVFSDNGTLIKGGD